MVIYSPSLVIGSGIGEVKKPKKKLNKAESAQLKELKNKYFEAKMNYHGAMHQHMNSMFEYRRHKMEYKDMKHPRPRSAADRKVWRSKLKEHRVGKKEHLGKYREAKVAVKKHKVQMRAIRAKIRRLRKG